MTRHCTQCAAEYPAAYPSDFCTAMVYGGYCGGTVPKLDSPITAACLICLDQGEVQLSDNTTRRCPRGCAPLQHAENGIPLRAS